MGRPYSQDLRGRVVAAVEDGRLSRRKAAAHFAVGISTVINWLRRFRETGSVLPGKMGGHKLHAIAGEHRAWLLIRIEGKDFTFARARLPSLPGEASESITRRCGTSFTPRSPASDDVSSNRHRVLTC
jgi:putative transposase